MKANGRTRLAVATAAACVLVSPAAAQVQQVLQPEAISRTDRSFELGVRAAPMARGTALPELATPDELALRAAPPPSGSPPVDPGAEFDIALLQSRIWNPNTGRFDRVEHRGYVDRRVGTTEGNLYQAPLIEARPGETVRINFRNLLPAEANCTHTPETMNNPDQKACYNDTNNHFHGGWVNPDGISDNVLRVLKPHPTHLYEYEYNIPQEHPAGTFWYHPHVHGSTAIQVGSGMAGALIIRGDRWPVAIDDVAFTPGDIDVLLRTSDGQAIPDKVFLLQQIQYACGQDAAGQNIWNCP